MKCIDCVHMTTVFQKGSNSSFSFQIDSLHSLRWRGAEGRFVIKTAQNKDCVATVPRRTRAAKSACGSVDGRIVDGAEVDLNSIMYREDQSIDRWTRLPPFPPLAAASSPSSPSVLNSVLTRYEGIR
ncbi:hypothetical protein PFISCL1PPCAC_5671, partial [Pristionchus fissidentatus]